MFHDHFVGSPIGIGEGDRTVWKQRERMRWSVWDGFIYGENPEQFETDFASAPRHFGMYDRFGGKCNREADVHDYAYRKDAVIFVDFEKWPDIAFPDEVENWFKSLNETSGLYADFPKELADLIFKQLMIEEKETDFLATFMYKAVDVFGSSSFHVYNVMDHLPLTKAFEIKEIKP